MREELSIEDVEAGVGLAREEIREKILQTTYAELSAGDLRFVNAMLEAQGDPTLAEVSERLGKPSNYASKYKARLIEQGVIGTTPRNTLRFELPMFEAYAREMMS